MLSDELGRSALCAAILGGGVVDKLVILGGADSPTEMRHLAMAVPLTTAAGDGVRRETTARRHEDGGPLDDGGRRWSPARDGWPRMAVPLTTAAGDGVRRETAAGDGVRRETAGRWTRAMDGQGELASRIGGRRATTCARARDRGVCVRATSRGWRG
jgi:hypothetical protein